MATIDRADAVADGWREPPGERAAVVRPLSEALVEAGLTNRYPAMLVDAVESLGRSLPAPPVAAPPYVVITGTGPVLRASLPSGRLVVRLAVFAVERDPKRYVRRGTTAEGILDVERR